VAVAQYTYTHKQYTERHKTNNTYNNTKIRKSAGRAPSFAGFTLAFALQLREKHGKTSVRVAIHKHTIRIHSRDNKNIQITLLNRNKTIYTLIKNRT
jgi:aspartate-semialdehyde dehydrogenase